MSKLYTRYLELKREDPNKMYLMKSGLFYIFIDEDAIAMSNMSRLKYLRRLKENGKIVEIVDLTQDKKIDPVLPSRLDCLAALESLDINTITPIEAIEYLSIIQKELVKLKTSEEVKTK